MKLMIIKILVAGCFSLLLASTIWVWNIEPSTYLPARTEDVSFTSEGIEIAGTLWLPEGAGPFPAIVMGHGSGKSTRSGGRIAAEHFSENGIAFLTYDKRGVGESEGVYVGRQNASEKNLKLLASDVTAGVSYLKSRNDIVSDKIGLWGVSQAGWILPIAASHDDEIIFTILLSGPTVTVGEENYYSDLTGDDGSQRGIMTSEEISALLAKKGPYGFDPLPYLEKMDMPGLWLLGAEDMSIPIPETVAHLDRLISEGQNFRYVVFPLANHGLRVNGRMVEDYWQEQDEFLKDVVKIKIYK